MLTVSASYVSFTTLLRPQIMKTDATVFPDFSTLAFSTPAISCRCFHSRLFHPCIFDRADFSTPAFSVAPTAYRPGLDGTPSLAASSNKMLMSAATVVQQSCKSCGTCFMFYCMFYFTCDRSFNSCDLSTIISDEYMMWYDDIWYGKNSATMWAGQQGITQVHLHVAQKRTF